MKKDRMCRRNMSSDIFTWNVGVVEVDGKRFVSFQFGIGENPLTADLDPDYALRIAHALESAVYDVLEGK